MKARNFILLLLAAYMCIFSMIIIIFNSERYFISELIILAITLIYALYALPKVISGKKNAYAYTTILFSILLLFTITLFSLQTIKYSEFAIMLLTGLFGLGLSIKKASEDEIMDGEYSTKHIIDDVPKFMPEIYDIAQGEKKATKPATKQKVTAKKKPAKKKQATGKTTKKKSATKK